VGDHDLHTLLSVDRKTPPLVPAALPLDAAIARSAPLALLRERLHDSQSRFAAIRGLLPVPLAGQVSPGPVDDEGWSLLASSGSAAAKLRQLRPRLEQALREGGWQVSAIRIKVQSR
jgi:hypothetical protein